MKKSVPIETLSIVHRQKIIMKTFPTCFNGTGPSVDHFVNLHFKHFVIFKTTIAYYYGIIELSSCIWSWGSFSICANCGIVTMHVVKAQLFRIRF